MEGEIASILVIEDEPLHRQLLRDILEAEGYRVLEAQDAQSGLRMARERLPDLVFLDVYLPGQNGLEVARALKGGEGYSFIPVVALTAMAMKGDRETCLQAGCDDYLAKPIAVDAVVDMARRWLQANRGG